MPDYPIPAIQHTRCVLALSGVGVFLELFTGEAGAPITRQLAKIARWQREAGNSTRKRRISAGARRDLDRAFDILAAASPGKGMAPDELFRKWAALVHAALTFVEDARNTCPDFTTGEHGRAWRYLQTTINTLVLRLVELEAGIDEQGTALYEKAAWALEGVEI